ncbi:hypothetical protein M9Y10_036199 [Tritrichomonas musculus]|uniref:DH domain-containing protein n=1 Tax=Tritrichomonas musculus TaxID=1915356 RepID=A0ABR2GUQ3_9EUKA
MEKQYIVITRPAEPSQVVNASFVMGKTTYQIKRDLNLQKEILFITTPYIRWPLLNQSIPSNDYPQLLIKENPGKYTRPDYYLTILPYDKQNDLIFYVKVQTEPDFRIPPFEVSIRYQNEYSLNLEFFLQCAIQQFQLEGTNYHLLLDGLPACGNISFSRLAQTNLVLFCTLTNNAQYIVRTRMNIINEIQSTEQTYLNGLHHLYNDWRKELIANKMITDAEDTQIFKTFPSIILCHESFLKSIQSRAEESNYGAMYSDVFLDFASYFKISLNYISNYHKVIEIIKEKSKRKEWVKKLNELETKLGLLSNYLITPVQRMPRYILFLRELIKFTPSSHPDAELLKMADESMREIANQINGAATIAENENKVFMIHQNVENANILEASRIFIAQYQVTYTKNSIYPATLYVFNDLILITRKDKGNEKEIFASKIEQFRYTSYFFTKIVFFGKGNSFLKKVVQPVLIEFRNKEEKQSFDSDILKQKNDILVKKNLADRTFSFTTLPDESTLYLFDLIDGCECCSTEKGIFTFAGSKMIWYHPLTNKIDYISTRIEPRTNYSLTYIEELHTIYIFGGLLRNGEATNEMWAFDIQTMKEDFVISSNPPEGRYGHSTVAVRNLQRMKFNEPILLIFGGISKHKKYLNDVSYFKPSIRKWICHHHLPGGPGPRAFHSATAFTRNNRNIMYVYGGIQERGDFLSDFYSLDFSTLTWKMISTNQLQRRAYHRAITVGDDIIIMGGINNSNLVLPPLIIDTHQETAVRECISVNNDPPILKDFGIAVTNGSIFIFNGENFNGKFTTNTIYKVTPPSILEMDQNKSSSNLLYNMNVEKNNKYAEIQQKIQKQQQYQQYPMQQQQYPAQQQDQQYHMQQQQQQQYYMQQQPYNIQQQQQRPASQQQQQRPVSQQQQRPVSQQQQQRPVSQQQQQRPVSQLQNQRYMQQQQPKRHIDDFTMFFGV